MDSSDDELDDSTSLDHVTFDYSRKSDAEALESRQIIPQRKNYISEGEEDENPSPRKITKNPQRVRQDLELMLLHKPKSFDRTIAAIRKPKLGLPSNSLPRWKELSLDEKLPLVPAPFGTFVNSRNKISKSIFLRSNTIFDTMDPYLHETPIDYNPLHDPHLKYFFQTQRRLVKRLVAQGLLTSKGEVPCNLVDFNKYRSYLGRTHRIQILAQRKKEDEWKGCLEKQRKRLIDCLVLGVKVNRDDFRVRHRLAILQEHERRCKILRQKWAKRSDFPEMRALELAELKRRRKVKRMAFEIRLASYREKQKKHIERIIWHIICDEEFSARLRHHLCLEKCVNHEADLQDFIKKKREYQENKLRYHHALIGRDKLERRCRIEVLKADFDHKAANTHIRQKKRIERMKKRQERRMYLMRKYFDIWYNLTKRSRQDEGHQSVWKIRQLAEEINKDLHSKIEKEGVEDLLTSLFLRLRRPKPSFSESRKLPTTKTPRTDLIDKLTHCLVDFTIDEAEKRIVDHICKETIDPNDLREPKIPILRKNQIRLEQPYRPCTGPCAQFGRGDDWIRKCLETNKELKEIKQELKTGLKKKLVGNLRPGLRDRKGVDTLRRTMSDIEQNPNLRTAIDAVAGIAMDRASLNPAEPKMQKQFTDYAANRIAKSLLSPKTSLVPPKSPKRQRSTPSADEAEGGESIEVSGTKDPSQELDESRPPIDEQSKIPEVSKQVKGKPEKVGKTGPTSLKIGGEPSAASDTGSEEILVTDTEPESEDDGKQLPEKWADGAGIESSASPDLDEAELQDSEIGDRLPSKESSVLPSKEPSVLPSKKPSALPSKESSALPSKEPSAPPSKKPSALPSTEPSALPSTEPSALPSKEPATLPSKEPSALPSEEPSALPSKEPSALPSKEPSALPSKEPSALPSKEPLALPSKEPSALPSKEPSALPSKEPSAPPSKEPPALPSKEPSTVPSKEPPTLPSKKPSTLPLASKDEGVPPTPTKMSTLPGPQDSMKSIPGDGVLAPGGEGVQKTPISGDKKPSVSDEGRKSPTLGESSLLEGPLPGKLPTHGDTTKVPDSEDKKSISEDDTTLTEQEVPRSGSVDEPRKSIARDIPETTPSRDEGSDIRTEDESVPDSSISVGAELEEARRPTATDVFLPEEEPLKLDQQEFALPIPEPSSEITGDGSEIPSVTKFPDDVIPSELFAGAEATIPAGPRDPCEDILESVADDIANAAIQHLRTLSPRTRDPCDDLLEKVAEDIAKAALQHLLTRDPCDNFLDAVAGDMTNTILQHLRAVAQFGSEALQPPDPCDAFLDSVAGDITTTALQHLRPSDGSDRSRSDNPCERVLDSVAGDLTTSALQRVSRPTRSERPHPYDPCDALLDSVAGDITTTALQHVRPSDGSDGSRSDNPCERVLDSVAGDLTTSALQRVSRPTRSERPHPYDPCEALLDSVAGDITTSTFQQLRRSMGSDRSRSTAPCEEQLDLAAANITATALEKFQTLGNSLHSVDPCDEMLDLAAGGITNAALQNRHRVSSLVPEVADPHKDALKSPAEGVTHDSLASAQHQKQEAPIPEASIPGKRVTINPSIESVHISIPSTPSPISSEQSSSVKFLVAPRILPTQSNIARELTPSELGNMTYDISESTTSMRAIYRPDGKLDVHDGRTSFFPPSRPDSIQLPSSALEPEAITSQASFVHSGNVFPTDVRTQVQEQLRQIRAEVDQLTRTLKDAGVLQDPPQ